jgi:hypothetical protein
MDKIQKYNSFNMNCLPFVSHKQSVPVTDVSRKFQEAIRAEFSETD